MTTALVAELSNDVDGTTVTASVVEGLILLSDNDINDYLRGRYVLPITSPESLPTLKDFSLTLTEYRLYKRRVKNNELPRHLTEERNRVIAELEKIQRGKRTLATQGAGETGRKPKFSRANFRTPAFDENELSAW